MKGTNHPSAVSPRLEFMREDGGDGHPLGGEDWNVNPIRTLEEVAGIIREATGRSFSRQAVWIIERRAIAKIREQLRVGSEH